MKIQIKGGVWRNTEDEILKAAVSKYGMNQWARISSLLVRKSAKQCKARWYEWLDPSIRKTEWSRDEDEKLLHLAQLMPTQWRTIAPLVGRTAAQCVRRYEQLLDQAQGKEDAGPDDPRRLRPGEIDPEPETKRAKPDAVDMSEEEKEMLNEAKARMANTQGKKAKRKERERALNEAKRLATVQKLRELKAAGIEVRQRKKRARAMDLNQEIPFEVAVPRGLHTVDDSIEAEQRQPKQFKRGMTLQELQGKSRAERESDARKEDARKQKQRAEQDLEAHLAVLAARKAPNEVPRAPLSLKRPRDPATDADGFALPDAATPRLPGSSVMTTTTTTTTSMMMHSNTPGAGKRPRTLQDVMATPVAYATPRGDGVMDAPQVRRRLASALSSLPAPKQSYRLLTPDMPGELAVPRHELDEDAADVEARKAASLDDAARAHALLQTSVRQRALPRPSSLPRPRVFASPARTPAFQNAALASAAAAIEQELARMLAADIAPDAAPDVPRDLTPDDLARARAAIAAEADALAPHTDQDMAAFQHAWCTLADQVVYVPGERAVRRVAASEAAVLCEVAEHAHTLARKHVAAQSEALAKQEKRLSLRLGGYAKRASSLAASLVETEAQIAHARIELACHEQLATQEAKALPQRMADARAALDAVRRAGAELDQQYADLVSASS